MAKSPRATRASAPAPAPAPAAPTAADTATAADAAAPETICMLVGQEGPDLSRVRGQVLVIGVDVGADEAERLVGADFAERV